MDIEDQFSLDFLLFKERKCRSCGKTKDLMSDFYLTRKDRSSSLSAYSYECKQCTIQRIKTSRKNLNILDKSVYPDW
jgi:predicted nucleic acid-binding Zn ribbon protein